MATVRDRLNMSNRSALEKWTKREQLCLATAVSCSGDQNWMTVSRSLKLLCGAHHPPDWFSQKLCAVKYGELLENVETPKRKKRTTSDNASNVVETPTDLILRRLTEERIQELKSEIREQQETYAKLYTDVVHLQTGNSNEEQIRAMWMEIEREQELDRQMKARKQMATHEMQRNWRQNPGQLQKQQQMTAASIIGPEQDMDIDETCKPQGTSPLLSSLLKSSSPAPAVCSTPTTTTSRVSAPTITNLLTGGVVSSSTSSSSSSLASSPSSQAGSLLIPGIPLSKPLTGPVPAENTQAQTQTVLSPSQSAPTLSMLLEKNKLVNNSPQQPPATTIKLEDEIKTEPVSVPSPEIASVVVKDEAESTIEDVAIEDGAQTPTKEEEQQLMEVFKNFMPEITDEFADILTSNNGILNPAILEEESILEGVDSLMDVAQDVDDQLEVKLTESELTEDSKNPRSMEEGSGAKIKEEQPAEESLSEMPYVSKTESPENTNPSVEAPKEEPVVETIKLEAHDEKPKTLEDKVETISSDDSSDNVPLAHTKDAKVTGAVTVAMDCEETVTEVTAAVEKDAQAPSEEDRTSPEEEVTQSVVEVEEKSTEDQAPVDDDEERSMKDVPAAATAKRGSISDSSDVIIIPTDDESNDGKVEPETSLQPVTKSSKDDQQRPLETLSSQTSSDAVTDDSPFRQEQPVTSICLPDTDDDSSTFEAPTSTSKDEKPTLAKQPASKKPESDSVKVEEESKQTLSIRKLRDRDRSESPFVDDDVSDHSVTVRSRRRYSSTPVIDSIPNSPASSDDREIKVWKKPLMSIYNQLLTNKNASMFLRPISEEQNPRYKQVCNRPMDLQIIKQHIFNGTIRNVTDLQRDVFLMCTNAIMIFKSGSSYANMARDLMHEFVQLKDQMLEAKMDKSLASSSPYTPGVKVRARKSQRLP